MKPIHYLSISLLAAGSLFAAIKTPSSSIPSQSGDSLRIDDPIPGAADMQFPNPSRFGPDSSQIQIVGAVPMSNELGERWALVTVYNPTGGKLEMDNSMLMATFANGDRILASNLSHIRVDPRQNQSYAVSFGINKFPIVRVEMR